MLPNSVSRALKGALLGISSAPPTNSIWTPVLVQELLKQEGGSPTDDSEKVELTDGLPDHLPGVPSRPFSSAIARVISWWSLKGEYPFSHIPFPLLKEKPVYFERFGQRTLWSPSLPRTHLLSLFLFGCRLEHMKKEIFELRETWESAGEEERVKAMTVFLEVWTTQPPISHFRISLPPLSPYAPQNRSLRDVLSLLGMRHTEGSLEYFPPSLIECLAAFNELHKPETSSVLTVGAKALTKHCHRDETVNWWGKVTVG